MLTSEQRDLLDDRIGDLCNALENSARLGRHLLASRPTWVAAPIRSEQRWQRIIETSYGQRSCHTWVDRTNGMLTYGAWKAPSKNRAGVPAYRYDLLDDAAYATLMIRVLTEPNFWLYEDKITKACH